MKTIHPVNPRWNRIQQLFASAADLPPGERDVFLSAECGNDQALRQELNELLLADGGDESKPRTTSLPSPLTHAVNLAMEGTTRDRRAELIGTVVGAYKLTAILGHGGAGTVYLGERADRQYSAQVAVKVVANALLNDEVQRRFQAERQILANLNHPNIARLLDAGETDQGQPFLVMEYVHGETIDRYCDNQKLTVNQRLQLFVKVCEAVQFAHRNLVVHRDLKPGNILVTPDGTPKLLDFGIAKLLDASSQANLKAGQTSYTRINDRLLTPEYASPEQILGQTVTTTSDVYTLGIVLYELLTSVRPYQVNAVSQLELERSICIMDPMRPSYMLAKMLTNTPVQPMPGVLDSYSAHTTNQSNIAPPDTKAISYARGTSAKRLQQHLAGDIDAIVMRALRKEPELRYSSPEQLIDDIQRYLTQQPVLARQGNWAYYTKRFIRRHTFGVAMTTFAITTLIGFAVMMSLQAKRIAEQRDRATQESARAESVSNFMLEVFTASDPFENQSKEVTAKELLDKAGQRIVNDLNQQPEVRARLLEAIGNSYARQKQVDSSIKYLEDALRVQRQLPYSDNNQLAVILDELGHAFVDKGDFLEADKSLREARNLLETKGQTQTTVYLQTLIDSGVMEHIRSNIDAAQLYFERGLELSRKLHGNINPETAGALMSLAEVMMWQAKYDGAETLIREAVNIYHSTLPEKHPDRITADSNLGLLLYKRGKFGEAEVLVSGALSTQKLVYGNSNMRLASTYDSLSQIQVGQQKWDAAELSAREALAVTEKAQGKVNFYTGIMHSSVADILLKRKKYFEAEKEARTSFDILRATVSADHQYLASAEYLLASALIDTNRAKEAEPLLRANIDRWARAKAPVWRAARSESLLGATLLQLKKPTEVGQLLSHSNEILSAKDSGADADAIAIARTRIEQYQHCLNQHQLENCHIS